MSRFFLPLVLLLSLFYAPFASPGSPGPALGSIAPDFQAHNLITNQKIALTRQRGKVVILAFWNSWCGSCRRELPMLEKAQTLIGQDKLTVFAVSFQEDRTAMSTIRKMSSAWHINMIDDNDGAIASRYAISTIPYLFIIGRDGTVLASHVGYGDQSLQDLIDDINHALARTSPVVPKPPAAASG